MLTINSAAAAQGATSVYLRPVSSPHLAQDHWPPSNISDQVPRCAELCVATHPRPAFWSPLEQVHIALGGEGEMVVAYASRTAQTTSEVVFWPEGSEVVEQTATGTPSAYSQLMYIVMNSELDVNIML